MDENPYESPRAEGIPPPKQSTNRIAFLIVMVLGAGYAAIAVYYVISELRYKAKRREWPEPPVRTQPAEDAEE